MRTVRNAVILVVVFAIGVIAGFSPSMLASASPVPEGTVLFEPAQAAGLHPFTAAAVVEAAGPFGGTGSDEVCDPELLIAFLQDNPQRLRAWAGVHGIRAEEVPDFIRSLTPSVLTEDTPILNHGFANGRAFAFRAVLQAGTAVLVDDEGNPVVRCRCGNPLIVCPDCDKPDPECPDEPAIRDRDLALVRAEGVDDEEECGCPEDDDERGPRILYRSESRERTDDCEDDECPPEDGDPGVRTVRRLPVDDDDECCPPRVGATTASVHGYTPDDVCEPPCPPDDEEPSTTLRRIDRDGDDECCPPRVGATTASVHGYTPDDCPPDDCPETPSIDIDRYLECVDDDPDPTPQPTRRPTTPPTSRPAGNTVDPTPDPTPVPTQRPTMTSSGGDGDDGSTTTHEPPTGGGRPTPEPADDPGTSSAAS